jgi:hypothetical protein
MTLELPTGSPAPHDLATGLPWRDVDLGNRVMPNPFAGLPMLLSMMLASSAEKFVVVRDTFWGAYREPPPAAARCRAASSRSLWSMNINTVVPRRYFAAPVHATVRRLLLPLSVAQLLNVIDMSRELAILGNHAPHTAFTRRFRSASQPANRTPWPLQLDNLPLV